MTRELYIAGLHKVALLHPMWGKGGPLRLWAEAGQVCWEDSRTNEFSAMHWRQAGERTVALSEMVTKSHEQGYYSDETRALQKFIEEMEVVIRKAKEQGDDTPYNERKAQVTNIKPQEVDCW